MTSNAVQSGGDVATIMNAIGAAAVAAQGALARAPRAAKDLALNAAAAALRASVPQLLEANARDLEVGQIGRAHV